MKYILYLSLFGLIGLVSCTSIYERDTIKVDGIVDDWEDGGRYTTHPDSVRDATHADSIRFGLIPADSI